jgi:hypothetical protein
MPRSLSPEFIIDRSFPRPTPIDVSGCERVTVLIVRRHPDKDTQSTRSIMEVETNIHAIDYCAGRDRDYLSGFETVQRY